MAKQQTEMPAKPLESLIAEANEQAKTPPQPEKLPPITPADLAKLAAMTPGELLSLSNQLNAAAGLVHIALLTPKERAEAARLKLWQAGLSQTDMFKALPLLREALDRDEGKPSQSIEMKVENKGLNALSLERLLALDAELCRRSGLEPEHVRPMPNKLTESTF